MFNTKKTTLLPTAGKTSVTNPFVATGLKKSAETKSENGALKYKTTGNDFVDQFGKLGQYKAPRTYADISRDISTIFAQNPQTAVKFALYMRTITRQVQYPDGTKTETTQRGSGLKHESIMRFTWLAVNHPAIFRQNIHLLPLVGSWSDIFTMLQNDLTYNGWKDKVLDWSLFGRFILSALENENLCDLVKKYLPQIKSKSAAKTVEAQADTMIGKWLASLLFGDVHDGYKRYRKLKTSGTAHEWQKLISNKSFDRIDFKKIHGRALNLLVNSKFLANNGLETSYQTWIESQPIAKFTGYPHELFKEVNKINKKYQIDTLNKQFDGLVETAKKNAKTNTGLIVVRDTSGSMGSPADGTTQTCFDIAKALALFFSKMLPDGKFANSFIEFNSSAKMHTWKGSTAYENWKNDNTGYVGSTDFQSVIKLFVQIKNQGVSESDFPTGILCISDCEFNPNQLNKTNVQQALQTLRAAGFSDEYVSNFKIVLWNLQRRNGGDKFETHGETKNVFYFSGYDGSVVSFLTGVDGQTKAPQTDVELFEAAMNQEILNLVKV